MVKMNPQATPIAKLPCKFYARAKLQRISQIFSTPLCIIAGRKSRSKEKVIAKKEIKINSEICIGRSLRCCHQSEQRTEFQITIGRLETFEMKLILDLKFSSAMF